MSEAISVCKVVYVDENIHKLFSFRVQIRAVLNIFDTFLCHLPLTVTHAMRLLENNCNFVQQEYKGG